MRWLEPTAMALTLGMAATCLPAPGCFAAGFNFFFMGAEATGVRGAATTGGAGGGGSETLGALSLTGAGGGLLRSAFGGTGRGAMAVLERAFGLGLGLATIKGGLGGGLGRRTRLVTLGGAFFLGAAATRLRFFLSGGLGFALGLVRMRGAFGGAAGMAMGAALRDALRRLVSTVRRALRLNFRRRDGLFSLVDFCLGGRSTMG